MPDVYGNLFVMPTNLSKNQEEILQNNLMQKTTNFSRIHFARTNMKRPLILKRTKGFQTTDFEHKFYGREQRQGLGLSLINYSFI